MWETFSKSKARNIFFGGSAVFLLIFFALTAHSHFYILNHSTDSDGLTENVIFGKAIWERHSCINCHTLLGEGAYFAPELGNYWVRIGGDEDPEAARDLFKAWMAAQPTGIEGRRQMPQFNLTDEELDALAAFLEWTSRIDTQGWPPNEAG